MAKYIYLNTRKEYRRPFRVMIGLHTFGGEEWPTRLGWNAIQLVVGKLCKYLCVHIL